MVEAPDRTRAPWVRVLVVWGVAGVLVLVVGSMVFYRYFAHRWWFVRVAETTPSVAHLLDLYAMGRPGEELILTRLARWNHFDQNVLPVLARRLERGGTHCMSYLFLVESLMASGHLSPAQVWDLVTPFLGNPNVHLQDQALGILVPLADNIPSATATFLGWMEFPGRKHIDTTPDFSAPMSGPSHTVLLLRYLLQQQEVVVWQRMTEGLGADEGVALEDALRRYKPSPGEILPSDLIDWLEKGVKDSDPVIEMIWGKHLLNIPPDRIMAFAREVPRVRKPIWVALCTHPHLATLGDLIDHQEQWRDWLEQEDIETAACILTVLGNHPFPSYRSAIEVRLSSQDPTLRNLALVAAVNVAWPGVDLAVVAALVDPEARETALRALPAVLSPHTRTHLEKLQGIDRTSDTYMAALDLCAEAAEGSATDVVAP